MLKKIISLLMCTALLVISIGCSDSDESGDKLSRNKWETASGTLLGLYDKNEFKWYNSSSDRKDNYYSGTYTVMYGQEAVDYLYDTFSLDKDGQKNTLSQYSVSLDDYYVLVLENKERVTGGENDLDTPFTSTYYGYYKPDYEALTLVNYDNQKEYNFKLK